MKILVFLFFLLFVNNIKVKDGDEILFFDNNKKCVYHLFHFLTKQDILFY